VDAGTQGGESGGEGLSQDPCRLRVWVLRKSFAPTLAALRTSIHRHAPTCPRCTATMNDTSQRAVTRSRTQSARSRSVGGLGEVVVFYRDFFLFSSFPMFLTLEAHETLDGSKTLYIIL